MEPRPPMPLQMPLPRPARGGSSRAQFGSQEVVLESTRGGYSLLWSDGRETRRYAIGLPVRGELAVTMRAPRLPIRVFVRDTLALAPGSRLRGYVQVPLVPTIAWWDADIGPLRLAEFPRPDLSAEWDDREGTVYRCVSPFHVRHPIPGAEPRATVPVWIANRTDTIGSPGFVPMQLADDELRALRGGVGVLPRRLQWDGQHLLPVARRRARAVL